jgi:hypothetical protein
MTPCNQVILCKKKKISRERYRYVIKSGYILVWFWMGWGLLQKVDVHDQTLVRCKVCIMVIKLMSYSNIQ